MNKKEFFDKLIELRSDYKLAKNIAFANEEWLNSKVTADAERKTEYLIQKAILELRIPRKIFWNEFIYYLKTNEVR